MLYRPRLYVSLLLITIVITIGVLGFVLISDTNFIDALYMTIITMSTVGFGEIHTFTPPEKLFTIFLIILSIIVYGYSVTALTEYFGNVKMIKLLKTNKVQKKINNLKNHTVVCGYGRNGKQAVNVLRQFNQPCVVIEKGSQEISDLERDEVLYIEGDATNDEDLNKLQLENAKSLITVLPSDADNLFVVLSARQFNKNFTIISRASNESSYGKLKFAGATNVIMPNKLGGGHMASLVVTPDLVEFVDMLTISGEIGANLEEILINELPKKYESKTILDLDLRKKTGCTVIGLKTKEENYIVNPASETKLEKDSRLIVLGNKNQIALLRELF